MNVKTGFERFEKSGAGILPVIFIAGLTILGTMGVVELAAQIPNEKPRLMSLVIDLGAMVGKSLGYGERYEPVDEGTACFDKTQKELPEISKAFPAPAYSYVGAFQVADTEKGCFHVYLNESQQVLVEVLDMERRESAASSRYLVCMTSVTDDQRLIKTCNSRTTSFARPWIDEKLIETSEELPAIVSELEGAHKSRMASLSVQSIPPDTVMARSREEAERTALWLIEQAPLPLSMMMDYSRELGIPENPRFAALLLMGFCRESSKGYDRVAKQVYLDQLRTEGKDAIPPEQLFVMHAMTNELHLCDEFPASISNDEATRRLDRDWLNQIIADGKRDPQRIERFLHELTQANPLTELGSIERPFPARIYQRSRPLQVPGPESDNTKL
jgi:hypothetical protein